MIVTIRTNHPFLPYTSEVEWVDEPGHPGTWKDARVLRRPAATAVA